MQAVMLRVAPARVKMDLPAAARTPADLRKRDPTPEMPRKGFSGVMFFINMVVAGLHSYADVA
jgi:hypothetical protein